MAERSEASSGLARQNNHKKRNRAGAEGNRISTIRKRQSRHFKIMDKSLSNLMATTAECFLRDEIVFDNQLRFSYLRRTTTQSEKTSDQLGAKVPRAAQLQSPWHRM